MLLFSLNHRTDTRPKLDRIGCQYNAPAAYRDGVFEKCKGDDQDYPGVYTGSNGKGTVSRLLL